MKKLLPTLFALFVLFGCEEEQPKTFDFPRLKTLAVSEINEKGATFKLEIEDPGKQQFDSFGFIWDVVTPKLNISEYQLVKADPGEGIFDTRINSLLLNDVKYEVRSFVVTQEYTVYGNSVVFTAKGSEGPVVHSIIPGEAAPLDTITIRGEGFSIFTWENDVFLDSEELKTIRCHHDYVKFYIPREIDAGFKKLEIRVYDQKVNQDLTYKIVDP